VTIALSDHREFIAGQQASDFFVDVTEPVVLNGRIRKPGHTDQWRIHAHPSTTVSYRLVSSSLGSELDATIQFAAADGSEISTGGSTLSQPVEAQGEIQVPANGQLNIAVRHVDSQRGGDNYAYRLLLDPLRKPSWNLQLTTDAVTVFRGREASLGVTVVRQNGMQQPVRLELEGLPDDVTCEPVEVSGDQSSGTLTLRAAATAVVEATPVRVVGTISQEADDEQVPLVRQRIAVMPRQAGSPERDEILLAVAVPTPFRIVGDQYRIEYAARGTVHRRPFVIQRNGYSGPLTLRLADSQVRHLQGVTAAPMTVPAGVSEVSFPVQIPPWLEMSRTGRIVVTAVGQIQDEQGRLHAVSNSTTSSDDQIIILTAPAPLGVVARPQALRLHAGQTSKLAVTVKRGQLMDRPVEVVLELPNHMKGISAAPLLLTGDSTSGTMAIEVADSFGPLNMAVRLRATTRDENSNVVVADCAIEFVGDRRQVSMNRP